MLAALVNGAAVDTLALSDRALHYGDGLFETIAAVDGRPLNWAGHMARLCAGCERLRLPLPDHNGLFDEVCQLAAGRSQAIIKIIYSRGSGGRGYRPPESAQPSRIVLAYAWPDYPVAWAEQGVRLHLCQTPCAISPALAGLKHLNRLEHVLARAEWSDADIAEGVMCDADGYVVEGTMSNLVWLSGDRLYTPALDRAGVAGTMRALLLQLAAGQGLQVEEGRFKVQAMLAADEIWLTNAIIGLWPVRECADRVYVINRGRQLQSALLQRRVELSA